MIDDLPNFGSLKSFENVTAIEITRSHTAEINDALEQQCIQHQADKQHHIPFHKSLKCLSRKHFKL